MDLGKDVSAPFGIGILESEEINSDNFISQENNLDFTEDEQTNYNPSGGLDREMENHFLQEFSKVAYSKANKNSYDPMMELGNDFIEYREKTPPVGSIPTFKEDKGAFAEDVLVVVQVFVGYDKDASGNLNIKNKKWENVTKGKLAELKNSKNNILCRVAKINRNKNTLGLDIPIINGYFIVYPSLKSRISNPNIPGIG